jgi:hypothetical protein
MNFSKMRFPKPGHLVQSPLENSINGEIYMNTYKYMVPISMPRGTHYGNNYYETYSKKINRNVKLFSNLEYENFLCLELDSSVEFFCEQPLKISVILDGVSKTTIFDMWVRYKNGVEEFQEIKYSSSLNGTDDSSIRTKLQIKTQQQWCKENDYNYVIRTEKDINTARFKIRNLKYIAGKIRRFDMPNKDYFRTNLVDYLKKKYKTNIYELINNNVLPSVKVMEFICFMYYEGVLDLNINDRPISKDTEVILYGN